MARKTSEGQLEIAIPKSDGFGHEMAYDGMSNNWITPKWIIEALGPFDLDPCASETQPWPCATKSYTLKENGLTLPWGQFHTGKVGILTGHPVCVFLNPPYGPHAAEWVKKMARHGRGIALIFARTETALWQDWIFPTADGYLFPRGRIAFHRPDGTLPKQTSGAPSALIAWSQDCRERLIKAVDTGKIPGAFVDRAFYTETRSNQGAILPLWGPDGPTKEEVT